MRKFIYLSALLVPTILFLSSCSRNTMSERDAIKEQKLAAAETKRQELQTIVGAYHGKFSQANGVEQNVSLKLEIKDIPTPTEGSVDPVMTPTLTGYFRFNVGNGSNKDSEYIGFAVQKADFNPSQNKLDLVVTNSDYKDIIMTAFLNGTNLTGTWTAPSAAVSGDLNLSRLTSGDESSSIDQLGGEYGGILQHDEKGLYQYSELMLTTSLKPPEGLRLVATIKIIFGDWNSNEYLIYKFDPVQYNPLSGQMIFKSESNDVMFSGYWSHGELNGEWYSNYTGKVGKISFKKETKPKQNQGQLFDSVKGTYTGKLVNTNPQSNLPERMMLSLVTTPDSSKPNGIAITGSLRLYFGPFDSNEYMEFPCSEVQFNFLTRNLVARVNSEYKFTLRGISFQSKITGTLSADALGEVGKFEVTK